MDETSSSSDYKVTDICVKDTQTQKRRQKLHYLSTLLVHTVNKKNVMIETETFA